MQDYIGYRTQKRLKEKRKHRALGLSLLALAVLVALFLILGAAVRVHPFDKAWDDTADGFRWVGRKISGMFDGSGKVEPLRFLEEGKKTANYLLAVTKEVDGFTRVSTIVVASYDSRERSGSLVYIPVDLQVQAPGIGEELLRNLLELDDGSVGLTLVAVENLLGVRMDRYIIGSDGHLWTILRKLGGSYKVDVPARVSIEDKSLDVKMGLPAGERELSGDRLASYLTHADPGKDLDLIKRQISFVPEFLGICRDEGVFGRIPAIVGQNADLLDTSASDAQLAGLWQGFALLEGARLKQAVLPVKEMRIEKTIVHLLDREKLPAFKDKYINSDYRLQDRVRLEILNGCGTSGISERVADQLDPEEYEVVKTGNADSFEHEETVIIIYGANEKTVRAAEKVQRTLEVGRIEVRSPDQNMLEMVIVVGKDYADR